MVDGPILERWQYDCLRELLAVRNTNLLLVICNDEAGRQSRDRRACQHALFDWYRQRIVVPAREPVDAEDLFEEVPWMTCRVKRRGHSEFFDEQDIRAIEAYGLDFILKFGFSIIRGEILKAAKFGVWSFHHGDNRMFRGRPAGFWEIYYRVPASGAMLQRLTTVLDGGITLRCAQRPTIHTSYARNVGQLLELGIHWPSEVCRAADTESLLRDVEDAQSATEIARVIHRKPTNAQMIRFLCLLAVNHIPGMQRSRGTSGAD